MSLGETRLDEDSRQTKPVTRSVRYRDREHDQHRDKDREMLARGQSSMVTTSVSRTLTLASSQNSTSWSVIRSLISSSRIILTSCNECRDECCDENRFGRGIEFKCILEGHPKGRFEYGFKCVFKCVYTRNEKAAPEFWEISPESTTARVRGMRVQMVHTSVALD